MSSTCNGNSTTSSSQIAKRTAMPTKDGTLAGAGTPPAHIHHCPSVGLRLLAF
jgi:hypothetical protein